MSKGFSALIIVVVLGLLVATGAVVFIAMRTKQSVDLPAMSSRTPLPNVQVSTQSVNQDSLSQDLNSVQISDPEADFKSVDTDIKQL